MSPHVPRTFGGIRTREEDRVGGQRQEKVVKSPNHPGVGHHSTKKVPFMTP